MKEGGKPETAEENPKKLEQETTQERAADAAVHDPLVKDRSKV